jgi:hypothetical protein
MNESCLGTRSIIYVVFALRRHVGYFLLQLYLPCTLIVFLSWVGLWLNREATNDRINLGKYRTYILVLFIFLPIVCPINRRHNCLDTHIRYYRR